jgi:anti-anti-sigma factor
MSVGGLSSRQLQVDVHQRADHIAIAPTGELDIATCGGLEDRVAPMLQGDALHVVIELSGLSFVDVAGMRALARCAEIARRNGVRFSLALADERPPRLFRLCHLLDDCELTSSSPSREPL